MKKLSLMTICAVISTVNSYAVVSESAKTTDSVKEVCAIVQPSVPAKLSAEKLFVKTVNPEPEFSDAEKRRGYIIYRRPITEVIYPHTRPLAGQKIEQLRVFGAPGERLNVSFCIYPNRELSNFKVRLKGIEKFSPLCRLVTYWKTYFGKRWYRMMQHRLQLLPQLLERVTVHSSPAGQSQRYWITLTIPEKSKSGLYKGKICLMDDGYSKSVWLPLEIKVLPVKLLRSPDMGLSAFNAGILNSPYWKNHLGVEKINKLIDVEYRTMRDLGFTVAPVIQANWNKRKQKLFIHPEEIKLLRKNGFKGAIPVVLSFSMIRHYYAKYFPKLKITAYTTTYMVSKMPPEAFFNDITKAVAELEEIRKKNNWPEFIYLPIDEVQSQSADFGAKVFAAVKKLGVRIFATAQGPGMNANWGKYKDCVDFWNQGVFCNDFRKIHNDKKHGYWEYPNYTICSKGVNQQKSARCVYGYTFWKSGYTLLNPWTWRAGYQTKGIDFCTDSFGSTKLGTDGRLLLTPNWECVSAGINDGKYIYTLSKMLLERENNKDAECRKICKEAKNLLVKIWAKTNIAYKPYYNDIWLSANFPYYRREMADKIIKLSKFAKQKAKRSEFELKCELDKLSKKYIEDSESDKNLDVLYVGGKDFSAWKANRKSTEAAIKYEKLPDGKDLMLVTFTVDMKNKNRYPSINAPLGDIDLTKYDKLIMNVKVTSNRPELKQGPARLRTFILAGKNKWPANKIYEKDDIGMVREGIWQKYVIPVKTIIGKRPDLAKSARTFCFTFFEAFYKDGEVLTYQFKDIKFVKSKDIAIAKIIAPDGVLLPAKALQAGIQISGFDKDKAKDCMLKIKLIQNSRIVSEQIFASVKQVNYANLRFAGLKPGAIEIRAELLDKNNKVNTAKTKRLAVRNI